MINRSPRKAFTLLEVLLASLIAILLLAALYFALDMMLMQTQRSRETLDVENLSAGVINRIRLDLANSVGPMPPKSGGNLAGSTAGTGTATTSSSTTSSTMTGATTSASLSATGAATTTTTSTATTASTTDPTTTDPSATPPQAADIGLQAGIVGTDKQLTVFMSRLPTALTTSQGLVNQPDPTNPDPSDLCRVTYWISQNGGLCRQERPWVTADGVRDSSDPDLSNEAGDLLVPEVQDVTFEYFDGSSWQSSWDGTQMSPDGVTPIGPPRAVRMTLTFSFPSPTANTGGQPYEPIVVSVIPIRAAPGIMTPTMITPSTDPGTASPSTTTGSTTAATGATTGSTGTAGTTGGAATTGAGATTGAKTTTTPTTGSSMPATTTTSGKTGGK